SLQVVEVLRAEGLEVIGMVSIFNYGFKIAEEAFQNAGVKLISLTDYSTLISLSIQNGDISPDTENTLLNWRDDPGNWKPNP
ncbi:MAG: orotate phosphoribosyltransferase, partial [Chitinophagaceae bacterium]